jgi:SAM-dependent methyltransferase
MSEDLQFTGERFLPGARGEIAFEHWHRYAFALGIAAGRRVLDAACGEGYGTALLATRAAQAIGVDIDAATVAHARETYRDRANLRYEAASVAALPLPDASVDVVVSFETIEHLPPEAQPAMLAEFARVLAPGGLLVISSPNKRRYSDERGYANPYHLHELYRADLERLLDAGFPARQWFHQGPSFASALWREDAQPGASTCEAWTGDGRTVLPAPTPEGLYYIVLAAKSGAALPAALPRLSLYIDRDDSLRQQADSDAREALRLDRTLIEREEVITKAAAHITHLEEIVAEHRRTIVKLEEMRSASEHAMVSARDALVQRDAELRAAREDVAQRRVEQARIDAALAAQERIITYRQCLRWWIKYPLVRTRLWWQNLTGR